MYNHQVGKDREKILFFGVENFTFFIFTHNLLSGESDLSIAKKLYTIPDNTKYPAFHFVVFTC